MRHVPLVLLLALLTAVCLPATVGTQPRQPSPYTQDPTIPLELGLRLDDEIGAAEKLRASGQLAAARAKLDALVAEAEQAGARRHQAAAFWAIGRIQSQVGDRAAAKGSFIKSRDLYHASGVKLGEAAASRYLGVIHFYLNEFDAAQAAIRHAIGLFEEINDISGLAISYNNLLYVYSGPDKDEIRAKALDYAQRSGDLPSACGALHEWGDDLFDRGDFIASRPKLVEALACYETVKQPDDIGRTLVSLGRLQRAHGQYQSALDYYTRALAIQEASGEPDLGAVQSLNAIATIYMYMGRHDQVIAHYERALERARALKSETTVTFLTGQLGNQYLLQRQYDMAIPMLESSVQPNQKAAHVSFRHMNLANAYHGIGQLARAQEFADLAVAESRPIGPDSLASALTTRADIARARGNYVAAERDLREAVQLVEEVRAKTIPIDFMKRGYADAVQNIYAATIELQMEQRHWRAAIETAEQARARAFLDLLASRTPTTAKAGTGANASPAPAPATDAPAPPANVGATATRGEAATTTRGASGGNASALTRRGGAIDGPQAAAGAAAAGVATTTPGSSAASGGEATDATPASAGPGGAANAAAGTQTRAGGSASAAAPTSSGTTGSAASAASAQVETQTRGGTAAPLAAIEAAAAARGVGTQLSLDSSRSAPPADMTAMIATAKRLRSTLLAYWVGQQGSFAWVVTPAGRVQATRIDVPATRLESLVAQANQAINNADGGGFALMGRSQTRPWRELYALLIKPVRAYLPTAPNSLLTIVPHGPLFRVSFAALQDENDRYLVERYRLHYTPAIGVLQFTAQHPRTTPKQTRRALLIGDPGPLTPEPGGDAMPALPWARREVDEIAAHLPTGTSRLLVDDRATEAEVRATLDDMDLVHFATHGVVRQERALSSFLALRGDGETDPARDGRLTAEEVYLLDLRARLVVLSACGTALGPMTGDGVIGFTRAFLYAGASSVIATEWDVPDEAGYELMRRFYRERAVTGRDSDALRSAQLGVIQSLRKGTMKVATPGGDVALPEHPLFWAGFVLVGEP